MSLKQQIYTDLVTAMKARKELKLSALRLLKAAIMKFEVSGVKKEATDEEVIKILKKEINQRQDSASQFAVAGRTADAEKEQAEMAILEKYLPAQMDEVEITKIAEAVIAETGLKSKADLGKLMGALMPRIGGQADGNRVREIALTKLN